MPLPQFHLLVVGYGVWGRKTAETLFALGQRVSITDADPTRLDHAPSWAQRLALTDAISERLDGIAIVTPASTHLQAAQPFLQAGVPVFVEKPLATSLVDARALADQAHLFVLHTWRYHPGIRGLRKIIDSGDIGEPTFIHSVRANWTSPRTDVDSVWNLAPHDISICQALLGHVPTPTFAVADVRNGRAVGLLAGLGTHPPFTFCVSNRYETKTRVVRVHGSAGVAVFDAGEPPRLSLVLDSSTGTSTDVPFSSVSAMEEQWRTCIEYLAGGNPPPTDAREGLAVVETIEALRSMAGIAP